jgi:thioredoxin 1
MSEVSQYVKEATDATFDEVVKSGHVVVIDCWAPWCGPCRMLAPIIEELAKDMGDKVSFYKLNVDENPKISTEYHIGSIPMVFLFVDGKLADKVIGAVPRQYIESKLKELMK